MLNPDELQQLYSRTCAKTQDTWAANPEQGSIFEHDFYDTNRLAITSGIKPALTEPLSSLLADINKRALGNPLADAMPLSGLHFTFFAITMPIYQHSDIARVDPFLLSAFAKYAKQRVVTISNLRLVALPNQLLIAGTPDEASLKARQDFAKLLQDSPWKDKLLERHGNIPLPPPFWHSTLLRYRAQYLPASFREYFESHRSQNYGSVSSPACLAFTNYNWTQVYRCEC